MMFIYLPAACWGCGCWVGACCGCWVWPWALLALWICSWACCEPIKSPRTNENKHKTTNQTIYSEGRACDNLPGLVPAAGHMVAFCPTLALAAFTLTAAFEPLGWSHCGCGGWVAPHELVVALLPPIQLEIKTNQRFKFIHLFYWLGCDKLLVTVGVCFEILKKLENKYIITNKLTSRYAWCCRWWSPSSCSIINSLFATAA